MAIIQGKAYWAKILERSPGKGYDDGSMEWSLDLTLTPEARAQVEEMGLGDKIRNKEDERGDFISFSRSTVRKDGVPGKPIEVVDGAKNPWDQNKLIGNGSVVNVKFYPKEWTFGKKTGVKPNIIKVQVVDLVPYEGAEDFPVVDEGNW